MIVTGGCHCGKVRFEATVDKQPEVQSCNCSICKKTGYLHLIVPREQFALLTQPENLSTYTFNTGVAQHTFCKYCGVKSFYTPRSNPKGISLNYRCLDGEIEGIKIEQFDGQNWEDHVHELKHLSD